MPRPAENLPARLPALPEHVQASRPAASEHMVSGCVLCPPGQSHAAARPKRQHRPSTTLPHADVSVSARNPFCFCSPHRHRHRAIASGSRTAAKLDARATAWPKGRGGEERRKKGALPRLRTKQAELGGYCPCTAIYLFQLSIATPPSSLRYSPAPRESARAALDTIAPPHPGGS
jgi:hypothetical protein